MKFVILLLLVALLRESHSLSDEEILSFKARDCFITKGTCNGEQLKPSVSVKKSGQTLTFRTSGIPDHDTAEVSENLNGQGEKASQKYHNYIKQQNRNVEIPNNPERDGGTICAGMGPIGIARNGVSLFNAYSATCSDAYMDEKIGFDSCNGHPTPDGTYHYHITPICLDGYEEAFKNKRQYFIGVAYDGFPIYSGYDSNGNWITQDKLDKCSGYVDENDNIGYRYVTMGENPYILGCFVGDVLLTKTGPCQCENGNSRRLLAFEPPSRAVDTDEKAKAFGGERIPRINAKGIGMGPGHRPPMFGERNQPGPGPRSFPPPGPGNGLRPLPNRPVGMRPGPGGPRGPPNFGGPDFFNNGPVRPRPDGMRPRGPGMGRGPGGDNRMECGNQSKKPAETNQNGICKPGPVTNFEKDLWGNPAVYTSSGTNNLILSKPRAYLAKTQTCAEKLEEELAKNFVGNYIPQCDDEGNYVWLQMWGSTGGFWCVKSKITGEEREGLEPTALLDRNCTDPNTCCTGDLDNSLACKACTKALRIAAYCKMYEHDECALIEGIRLQKSAPTKIVNYVVELTPEMKVFYLAGACGIILFLISFGFYRVGKTKKHGKKFRKIEPRLYSFPGASRTRIDDVSLMENKFSLRVDRNVS